MKTYMLKVSCANESVGTFVDALLAAGATEVSYAQAAVSVRSTVPTVPASRQVQKTQDSEAETMADVIENYFAERGAGTHVHVPSDKGLAAALKSAGYKTAPDLAVYNVTSNYHVKIKKVAPATYAYTG